MRTPKQSFILAGATPAGEFAGENSSNRWSDGVRALVSEGLSEQWRGDTVTATEVNKYKVHYWGMERGSLED